MFGELRPVDGGSSILLEKPSITVGQDRTCDVVIEHPSVSANHCVMEFREGHWFIEDLGSRVGIGVNGEKVESAWVPTLSVINIGSIEFDLEYSSAQATTEDQRVVSPEVLSKLDRAMKSVPTIKERRTQVRADQPPPIWVPKTKLGMLVPLEGEACIPLLYEELYLGRDRDCDVVLPYLSVANTHCVLRFQEGAWTVRDLHNNGVTIDGKPTGCGRLLPGAILGVASHMYALDYSTTESTPASESAGPASPVPVNESVVNDEDTPSSEGGVAHLSGFDEVEVDESALIDDDNPPDRDLSCFDIESELDATNVALSEDDNETAAPVVSVIEPRPQLVDEPEVAITEMLDAAKQVLHPTQDQPPPAVEPKVVAPKATKSKPVKSLKQGKKTSSSKKTRPNGRQTTMPATDVSPQSDAPQDRPLVVTKQQVSVVQQKHERIVQLLKDREIDGLLLSRPANIAWYTGGVDSPVGLSGQTATALLITPDGGTLLARKADRDLLLKHATAALVLQHRECAWPIEASGLLIDWLGSKKLACDQSFERCADVSAEVAALRLPLRPHEIENLRKLGIRVARTVERAAREFQRGDTEAQIAGDVASRLIRHEVLPVQIQVWGDGRGRSHQNWSYGRETVNQDCTISVVARRHGLHVAVSRTVSFGIPSKELRWTFQDMLLAHVTALVGSRDQTEISTLWNQVDRVCETLGEAEEWRTTEPGCVTGYELCESPISATNSLRLQAEMPLIWRSLIGPSRAVDTLLVREAESKVITQTGEWPLVGVAVNNEQFFVQTVLQRSL